MQPKIALFSLCTLIAAAPAMAQGGPPVHVGGSTITGFPEDWSHRHNIFSNPGSESDAIAKGNYAHWQSVVNNPRYVVQQLKHNRKVEGPAASDAEYVHLGHGRGDFAFNSYGKKKKPSTTIERDWSEGLVGAGLADGQYPAKYNYSTSTATCTDYVVFPTGANGSGTQATIVAYNSLYSGCPLFSGGKPVVYWAYNTGTGFKATTSPVLSWNGDQVAFIQSNGSAAQLVLLKMKASGGTVALPAAATSVATTSYRACAAPCYTAIPLQTAGAVATNDTSSAPFYVFQGTLGDTIFVGDDSGLMHEITGVFGGTPTVDPGASWPVAASTETSPALTSPVYDSGASGRIFVTDAGGFLHSFTAGTGTNPGAVGVSGRLENNTTNVFEPPVVDSTTEQVYVFVGYSGDTGNTNPSYINYFPAGTALAGGTGTGLQFNNGSATTNPSTSHMRAGSFDELYYAGTNTTGTSQGHLYVCENGTVYQVNVTTRSTGTLATTTPVTLSTPVSARSATNACSPVTEFLGTTVATTLSATMNAATTALKVTSGTGIANNDYVQVDSEIMKVTAGGGTINMTVTRGAIGTAAAHSNGAEADDVQDWLFLSVKAGGNATVIPTCAGACVYNYNVISSPATANPVDGLASTGGTSGIVIDSSDTSITGDAEIYYTQLGGTSAIQASQSALQ